MTTPIHVDIVSLEKAIFSGLVELMTVSGILGELGIKYGHAPLLTALKPGKVKILKQGAKKAEYFYISGGLLEVQPTNVTLLADSVELAKELNEAAALEAKKQAKAILATKSKDVDYSKAVLELEAAAAQIRLIELIRKIKQ